MREGASGGIVAIERFDPRDRQDVLDLILPIQQEEFGIAISAADQPDLGAIPQFYQNGRGDFWVARRDGRIIGTIGLKDIGGAQGALRKMFVGAPWRGREAGVARALLDTLADHARRGGLTDIFLGTTDRFLAAHRFYERSGFSPMAQADLPPAFPLMPVDTRFYVLRLTARAVSDPTASARLL